MSETLGILRPGRSPLLLAVALLATAGLHTVVNVAEAAKKHSFTFNGTLADTGIAPGGDAVIVNGPAGTPAGLVGGAVNLTVNNNTAGNSNQGDFTAATARGSYVDLPNGIFTGAAQTGTAGQISLEIWVTTTTNRTWAEIWSFGTSNSGENTSTGGGASDYVALIPQSGPTDFRAVSHQSFATAPDPIERQAIWSTDNAVPPADTTPVLSTGTKHHIVVTMDQSDLNGGAAGFEKGTMKLYLNGDLNGGDATPTIGGLAIADISNILDHNNWLGRSPWPDSLYQGTIDEFNIYDTALSASEVSSSFTTGPAVQAIPTLTVNRTTGAVTINNPVAAPFNIKQYSLTSASGSLKTGAGGWTSIDAANLDTNGTWTTQSLTDTNIAESNTGGTLDGAPLAGNSANSIGNAWIKSKFEDVAFNFTLSDGTTGEGVVNYIGAASYARSDLNTDGAITAADWAIFYPNGFTNISALSATAAALKGDLDGNKTNDYQDFLLFKADFIAANGAPAFAALTAVPEPAALVVALAAAGGLAWRRRR